jgi:hypothetical protein
LSIPLKIEKVRPHWLLLRVLLLGMLIRSLPAQNVQTDLLIKAVVGNKSSTQVRLVFVTLL